MYLYIVALHIISVVAWFAALFYLPRLFVYHSMHKDNAKISKTFETMEYKLYFFIGHTALLFVLVTGIGLLVYDQSLLSNTWIHIKLTLVFLLLIFHFSLNVYRKQLKDGICTKSEKFFRIYNEIPTIFLISIVILAVVKPFGF